MRNYCSAKNRLCLMVFAAFANALSSIDGTTFAAKVCSMIGDQVETRVAAH